MALEVHQLIVKSTIRGDRRSTREPDEDREPREALKREVLTESKRWLKEQPIKLPRMRELLNVDWR